jgi:hypothetical protein
MAASIAVQRPPWEANQFLREELSTVISNRSAAYFESADFIGALVDADLVIALRRNWSKGHFRKAKALLGLGRWEEAKDAVRLGLQFEPANKVRGPYDQASPVTYHCITIRSLMNFWRILSALGNLPKKLRRNVQNLKRLSRPCRYPLLDRFLVTCDDHAIKSSGLGNRYQGLKIERVWRVTIAARFCATFSDVLCWKCEESGTYHRLSNNGRATLFIVSFGTPLREAMSISDISHFMHPEATVCYA